jgi:hypothetical protein
MTPGFTTAAYGPGSMAQRTGETKRDVFEDLLSCYHVQREVLAEHPTDPVFQRELEDVMELFRKRFAEAQ